MAAGFAYTFPRNRIPPGEPTREGRTVMALRTSNRSEFDPFVVFDVMAQAAKMEEEGVDDLLHLVAGQPSTPAPAPAIKAVADALSDQASHAYTTTPGITPLREGIAGHYKRAYGLDDVSPDSIVATIGSSLGFRMAFTICFNAGDTVAVTNPGYTAYRNLMVAAGLKPLLIDLDVADGWRFNRGHLEALEKPPHGLVVGSPANPTGMVLNREEMRGVVDWCAENDVRLISDEVYHGVTFGDPAVSALELTRDAVVVNSFSKFFSMTGYRIGWIVLPDDLIQTFTRLAQNMYISVPTLSQIAATAAITDPAAIAELEGHVERYRKNRDILLEGLDPRLLNNAAPPEGAFYLLLDISRVYPDGLEMVQRLLQEAHVSTAPGVDFDPVNGNKALRLSFAGAEDDIREAIGRINDWVAKNAKD